MYYRSHLRTGLFTSLTAALCCSVFSAMAQTPAKPHFAGSGRITNGVFYSLVLRSPSNNAMRIGRFENNVFNLQSHADPGANHRIVGIVDLGADFRDDLVFQDMSEAEFGDVKFWRDFNSSSQTTLRRVKKVWDVQAVGNLDVSFPYYGDLVWRYNVSDSPDTGVSYVWFTDGAKVTQVRKRGGAPLSWKLIGASDLDGARADDMVYISPSNQIRVLMATADRTCANLSGGSIPEGTVALEFRNFSGNGRGDVLYQHPTTGAMGLVVLNATGITLPPYTGAPDDQNASCTASSLSVQVSPRTLPNVDVTWKLLAAGDFDGNQIHDIVWQKPDGKMAVWLMQSNGQPPIVVQDAGLNPFFVATAATEVAATEAD